MNGGGHFENSKNNSSDFPAILDHLKTKLICLSDLLHAESFVYEPGGFIKMFFFLETVRKIRVFWSPPSWKHFKFKIFTEIGWSHPVSPLQSKIVVQLLVIKLLNYQNVWSRSGLRNLKK